MALTTLKDDLLAEFREERAMINEQMELLDPMATALRKPAAQKLISSSTLIITEVACYIFSMAGIAFLPFMHRVFPFNILTSIFYNTELRHKLGGPNLSILIGAVYVLVGILAIVVFVIGRMAREMRLKNEILCVAARDVKLIVGQHLERKAAISSIEQRHMLGMSGIMQVPAPQPVSREVVHAA